MNKRSIWTGGLFFTLLGAAAMAGGIAHDGVCSVSECSASAWFVGWYCLITMPAGLVMMLIGSEA